MKRLNRNIVYLNEVDSTNNYANRLIATDCVKTDTVILTKYQSAGKGQFNNTWQSASDKNLLFSLITQPTFLLPEKQFLISKIISIAIVQYLSDFSNLVSIKWPNDIYIENKKIAGILIETIVRGSTMDYCVIGVGLNLNQKEFDKSLPNPISLTQLINKKIDIESALNKIIANFYTYYNLLKNNLEDKIDSTYFDMLYRKSAWHIYKKDKTTFEAKIIGIGQYGQLILQKRDESVHEYYFKEVEFVI